ncbi:preprotein translocase subunit SecA [Buchnera aphidicola (Shivaphis celti)]
MRNLLPEAFAVVRESSKRIFNMRHFDVQLLGGIVLHNNCIAEMRTGEGKTLTSTLSAYLNALLGFGVHIVTMNEYLAKRDAKKNKELFEFLGLTVGINLSGMSIQQKKEAYLCDITYGTNHEFCFDYLRDNMVFSKKDRVQRKLYYVLIDEVDSILIDEARTPLVISGPVQKSTKIYHIINNIVLILIEKNQKNMKVNKKNGYYFVDEKNKQVFFTELGFIEIEKLLIQYKLICENESLYSIKNIIFLQYVISSLKANIVFNCDVDYIIKNKKIVIIDEHTGRMMLDRRWSDGIHQAIEAKEKVKIFNENQTLASITLQNYFKLYNRISGMTGTAYTEEFEFKMIYNLDTIVIPTHCPMIRKDFSDLLYVSEEEKIIAVIEDIKTCISKKQPVLVGTTSIYKSEIISKKLYQLGISHNVLNAKCLEKEAGIIAEAGRLSAVTISTNMAGRGTDIILGGCLNKKKKYFSNFLYKKNKENNQKEHDYIVSIGGLHIIGTERHESRRIDNQLRGRSGRQGDPGSSRFYLSMEDPLIRLFVSKKVQKMIKNFGLKFGEPIQHNWINKLVSYAQKKIENHHFETRKRLLEYDDILDKQRKIIYTIRNNIVNMNDMTLIIKKRLLEILTKMINICCPSQNIKQWDVSLIEKFLKNDFNFSISIIEWFNKNRKNSREDLVNTIYSRMLYQYNRSKKVYGSDYLCIIEKNIMLNTLDFFWSEHLSFMEYLRSGIHFQCYAQKDPKQEYIKESYFVFSNMLDVLQYTIFSKIVKKIFNV